MHYALDGLLAGIVMPYDMKCHTDTNNTGMYSKELDLDYPSFGQVKIIDPTYKMQFFLLPYNA